MDISISKAADTLTGALAAVHMGDTRKAIDLVVRALAALERAITPARHFEDRHRDAVRDLETETPIGFDTTVGYVFRDRPLEAAFGSAVEAAFGEEEKRLRAYCKRHGWPTVVVKAPEIVRAHSGRKTCRAFPKAALQGFYGF